MQIEDGDFLLTEPELAAAATQLGVKATGLSLVPQVTPGAAEFQAVESFLNPLAPSLAALFRAGIELLAAPQRIARLHYSQADETITRSTLAWSPRHPEDLAALVRIGRNRRLNFRSRHSVRQLIARTLAAANATSPVNMAYRVSSPTILVFLAIADYLVYARAHSMLQHETPITTFSPQEIAVSLKTADKEDFRWPLKFLEKLLPVAMPQAMTAADVAASLRELVAIKLITRLEDLNHLEFYELTPDGTLLADALLHQVSKAGLAVAGPNSDGALGHDIKLFVRSAQLLVLFGINGAQGFISTLTPALLEDVLKLALTDVQLPLQAGTAPAAPRREARPTAGLAMPHPREPSVPTSPRVQALACAHCGKPLQPSAKFCMNCGTPAAKPQAPPPVPPVAAAACPRCGAALTPNIKFCENCGAALAKPVASSSPSPVATTVCPRCNVPAKPGLKFCQNCGGALA